ncbi:hypothetical protein EMIT0P265_100215 [Pseudomonas zeae]
MLPYRPLSRAGSLLQLHRIPPVGVSLLAIGVLNDTTQHKAWPLWHGPCVPVIQVSH